MILQETLSPTLSPSPTPYGQNIKLFYEWRVMVLGSKQNRILFSPHANCVGSTKDHLNRQHGKKPNQSITKYIGARGQCILHAYVT